MDGLDGWVPQVEMPAGSCYSRDELLLLSGSSEDAKGTDSSSGLESP